MPIILVLILLLGAGTAGAEILGEVDHSYLRIDRASLDAMLKDYPEAKLRVMLVRDPCLAKMEQAMKAMLEFINTRKPIRQAQHVRMGELVDEARECWKEKP